VLSRDEHRVRRDFSRVEEQGKILSLEGKILRHRDLSAVAIKAAADGIEYFSSGAGDSLDDQVRRLMVDVFRPDIKHHVSAFFQFSHGRAFFQEKDPVFRRRRDAHRKTRGNEHPRHDKSSHEENEPKA